MCHLKDTHLAQSSELKQTEYIQGKSIFVNQLHEWKPDWVTKGKLDLALHQFKSKKSPADTALSSAVSYIG